jgi:hypothetical protein
MKLNLYLGDNKTCYPLQVKVHWLTYDEYTSLIYEEWKEHPSEGEEPTMVPLHQNLIHTKFVTKMWSKLTFQRDQISLLQ